MELEEKEFSEKVLQVNRVSKKTKGGNKIGFSVLVVVGDSKGKVGVGLGKASDVRSAIHKGVNYAKKHLITVPIRNNTIPHEILHKSGAAKVFLKPASLGTGVIAGGAVRAVVEAAGISNILSKILGSANPASNVYATIEALSRLRPLPTKEMVEEKKDEEPRKKTKKTLKSSKEVVVVRKSKSSKPSQTRSKPKKVKSKNEAQ